MIESISVEIVMRLILSLCCRPCLAALAMQSFKFDNKPRTTTLHRELLTKHRAQRD